MARTRRATSRAAAGRGKRPNARSPPPSESGIVMDESIRQTEWAKQSHTLEFAEKANHPAFKAVAAQGDKIRGMKVPSLFPASSILPPFLSTFLSSSKRSFLSSSKHYFLPSFRPLLPSVLYFRPLLPPVLYFRPPVLPSSLRPFLPSSLTSFL